MVEHLIASRAPRHVLCALLSRRVASQEEVHEKHMGEAKARRQEGHFGEMDRKVTTCSYWVLDDVERMLNDSDTDGCTALHRAYTTELLRDDTSLDSLGVHVPLWRALNRPFDHSSCLCVRA
eukprot:SAG11_NODE_15215_length_585_cov_0.711934_1_plen_121_part_01